MTEEHSFGSSVKKYLAGTGLFILEFLKIAILAGITIALVRYYLFKPFYVKGASMEPNFYDHEYLIIDEITYRFNKPQRGDVIVFKYPDDPKEYFLKRIIGLPGERVKVTGGQVLIYNEDYPEGVMVTEEYLPKNLSTDGERLVTLGPDQFFVLGDNRTNSYDSRRFGPVDRNLVVGRAWFRGWPFSRAQILKSPEFSF